VGLPEEAVVSRERLVEELWISRPRCFRYSAGFAWFEDGIRWIGLAHQRCHPNQMGTWLHLWKIRIALLSLRSLAISQLVLEKKIKKEKNLEVESCLVVATFTSSKVIESVANFFSARRANFQLL
jgi:hypothetical protein